jgi:uncharacterized protein (DUF2267 family)
MDDVTFFTEVAERLSCDTGTARTITAAVFHTLRDRLTPDEAADVATLLSAPLRQLWQQDERRGRTVERIHAPEFLSRVRQLAGLENEARTAEAVEAVFHQLQRALGSPYGSEGEAWDVFSQLPKDLKMLWLAAGRAR